MKAIKCIMLCCLLGLICNSCSLFGNGSDELQYLAAQVDNKGNWAFVDPDGNIKYPDEFKSQPSAIFNGYFSVKENDGITLYRADDKPTVVGDLEGLSSVGAMSEGLIPVVKQGQRIAIVDKNGKQVFTLDPVGGKEVVECDLCFREGMLGFKTEDDKYGFYNTKGNVVIKPQYSFIGTFVDGKALVQKPGDSDEGKYQVIDKKGNVLFTYRDSYQPGSRRFKEDMIIVRDKNNDRYLFLDEKGEVKYKCPSKVDDVNDYTSSYFVFESKDGNDGLMDFNGEVLIRAKYNHIEILNDDKFACYSDGKVTIRNKADEELANLEDYKFVITSGDFRGGYDGSSYCLFDKNWKEIKNAEFSNISNSLSVSYSVESDYFNRETVINAILEMINQQGVGKYALGESPSAHFSNPEDYRYQSEVELDDLTQTGFRYTITPKASFSANMADYDWDYNYNLIFHWNPRATLMSFLIQVNSGCKWTPDISKALAKALNKKGFTTVVEKSSKSRYAALLKSSTLLLPIFSDANSCTCQILVTKYTDALEENLKKALDNFNENDDDDSSNSATDFDDTIVVEEAADSVETVADDSVAVAW